MKLHQAVNTSSILIFLAVVAGGLLFAAYGNTRNDMFSPPKPSMATIAAADNFGIPVSTTHVLSSGVAGTIAPNGSGIQMKTIRNIVLA